MRKNRNDKRQKYPQEEGLSVNVINGDVTKALRRLKRKVEAAGVIKELHERKAYEKPSAKRRRIKKANTRRTQKRLEKRKEQLGY
jgi:small subunit ribosomal protein S21